MARVTLHIILIPRFDTIYEADTLPKAMTDAIWNLYKNVDVCLRAKIS